ncbi:hypothetical protein BDV27DRAFT_143872 [Aspergillus caelatus]|uniref:Uncharacterized protein n=1 Tax=Aspergillus caelatus TaxID=61420 RepID=A0A5N7A932_9EURO|nr:uncharacterized protein BDV27DRAFT_143872 [Aspergillus caelatus]KAE8366153.1 hypothetical protein BDV27DRAFT_143872 [Aspergillus caelatus]
MKSILFKSLAFLPTLSMGAMATPLVSYAGYVYENCTGPSITATNIAASYCANVEDIPIKSFTAYVFSGACDDSKTPVLNVYTGANCGSGLFQTVAVDSEKQCFEADTTIAFPLSSILHPFRNPICSVFHSRSKISQSITQRLPGTSCGARDSIAESSSSGTCDPTDSARDASDRVTESRGYEFGGTSDAAVLGGGGRVVRHDAGGS